MSSFAIDILNAVKIYPDGFKSLNDVSFQVEQGEFFGLLGANGAGKTTLISAIAGILTLTSGNISVMGFDVKQSPFEVRKRLGVVPQELAFDPFLSIRETLRFQSGYFGIKKNDDWIDEVLHNLGLTDKADINSRELSGGMKRRLMVAQALVHKPPVIILDEPTAGVDVELRQHLWAFISRLNQEGHTIVLTTHYLEEAQNLCSRIAMLKKGNLVALDSTKNLLRNDAGIRIGLEIFSLPESLNQFKLEEKNNEYILQLEHFDELTEILQILKNENIPIKNLRTIETDLEDVFVSIMG